tara:strand:- start:656 stop:1387 length:732 start_codon:yes stop_codon:yes gene_type:complete
MKIRIIKKKVIDELSSMGGGAAHIGVKKEIEEVSSEKQRKYMCAMMDKPADERPKGLSKKEAEEMCKDTEHSKKIDELYSTSGAMMGSGSGQIPKERNPEAHKRYVRIRFTRQGLQNFKPSRYFPDRMQQLGEKKKKDPKKGTGKKPKGSGRRLYTDEDPSDTVSVKFSTVQDVKDTFSKASFKSKSHKRQSQIINLVHQRARAAYQNAKDPEVKKRLKKSYDYAKKRKEASKKKTQRMKKSK